MGGNVRQHTHHNPPNLGRPYYMGHRLLRWRTADGLSRNLRHYSVVGLLPYRHRGQSIGPRAPDSPWLPFLRPDLCRPQHARECHARSQKGSVSRAPNGLRILSPRGNSAPRGPQGFRMHRICLQDLGPLLVTGENVTATKEVTGPRRMTGRSRRSS